MYPKYVSKLPLIEAKRKKGLKPRKVVVTDLFNEKTFYKAFVKDLLNAEREIVICSPFVTKFRSEYFRDIFLKLKKRNINLFVITRPVEEYELLQQAQVKSAIGDFEDWGITVFCPEGYIHEKVAIIDRQILWEGSLNVLSQRESREIMRRTTKKESAMQVLSYLKINKLLLTGYKSKYENLCKELVVKEKNLHKIITKYFLLGLSIPLLIWCIFIGYKIIVFLSNFSPTK